MKKSFVAFMLMVVGLAGCDQAPQPYQQNYSQPTGYEQPDARVLDAAQRSRTTALANMRQTLTQARDSSRYDCDADDDIDSDNMSGDGDADCVVYRVGRQDQYECPSNYGGTCKPDGKRAARPAGYAWGYHAKQSSGSHLYTQAPPTKPAAASSYPAKPAVPATQPTTGFFGKAPATTGKLSSPAATPAKPSTGFFGGDSTKSSSGKSTTSKPSASTKSKGK